jgi:lipopolysaccharide transport system permease protein/teichoic acid transport system permease protein
MHIVTLALSMARNELRGRYAGNYGGILWAFLQPLATIGVLWFVFEVGFRSAPVSDHPFALWLSIGMIGWFFLSETVSMMTHSITSQSFLIKKIVFNTYLIPVSSLLASLALHFIFIGFIIAACLAYGYLPDVHWLGLIYYIVCGVLLCAAIGYLTSSISVFFPDIGQIVSIFLQFGFWLTPIFWSLELLPSKYRVIFELNPAYYIIQGYRDSLLGGVWFWDKLYLGAVFWGMCFSLLVVGIVIFKKLKPYFADAL